MQGQPFLLCRKAVDRPFARRAFVLIRGFVIDEVPLVEPTFGFGVGCERPGYKRDDACLLARQDLRGAEVTAIRKRRHVFGAKGILGLNRHM